jgi:hypothetical protein
MGKFQKMNGIAAIKLFNLGRLAGLSEELTEEYSVAEICSQEEFHSMLVREKARADRNGHGFSLVAVDVSSHEEVPGLTEELKQRIRTTDEIGWFDNNTLGVFLYNTSALGAWQFVNNSRQEKGDGFSISKCSVYSYPNDWCAF